MGWLPDYPDFRDYTLDHKNIKPMAKKIGVVEPVKKEIPDSKDLREWCPPIENQGSLGSCALKPQLFHSDGLYLPYLLPVSCRRAVLPRRSQPTWAQAARVQPQDRAPRPQLPSALVAPPGAPLGRPNVAWPASMSR